MTQSNVYVINGIFEETDLLLSHVQSFCTFSGYFELDRKIEIAMGKMVDSYGDSEIRNIQLNNNSFSFTKKYTHRNFQIQYVFELNNTDHWQWIGAWDLIIDGNINRYGKAVCSLSEIKPEMYLLLRR